MFLNCHTYHSLRYGTISVENLVHQAANLGADALCLTDINTVTAIYEFLKICKTSHIKPIAGVEIRDDGASLYIVLTKNAAGIREVNELLTAFNCDGIALPKANPDFKNCLVIYPIENIPEKLLDHEYIGIRAEQLPLLMNQKWAKSISKMVVLHPVTFGNKKEYNLHKILRAIDHNTLISKLKSHQFCGENEFLKPVSQVLEDFQTYPAIIENTKNVLEACHFDFEFKKVKNKKYFTNSQENDRKLLRKLALEGLKEHYEEHNLEARKRLEKELKVIDELHFTAHYLITWDIIQYSNRRGFMHIGRGSGANSLVSYCIGITNICPLELDLYFERFLNLNRKVPPDFDIDWSWQERDFILEYIFNKYGKNHVAFCGTNVEFKHRSIFREIGKVFGLPPEELEQLTTKPVDLHEKNHLLKHIHLYAKMLEKFPNQRSMHACGILISEAPLTQYSALEMPPKGFPIVQFDMHVAEEIGLEKLDILSQRGIGHIKDAVELIKKNKNITLDIANTKLSKDEKRCNEMLSVGQTIGCFYIESPAMRGLLRRLKCDNYKVLVAASSIIRPGVAQSGMMREYIFRHNHPDQFEYFHPVFEKQLGETYGIMVYQEDVIKIALHFGGLSAADGDVLRRAMSGKGRSLSELQKVKNHFFESCEKQGHPQDLSQEIYRQIESFAGYSFCKAHSASYAVESYQSLYLKAYFPMEFMVAVINNQGGFYRTEVYVHEAKMSGAHILNPCVNRSLAETTIDQNQIYLGFMHLQSLDSKAASRIVKEREENGHYQSLEDFIKRVPVGTANIQILIFIGAFRFTGISKNELLLTARMLLSDFIPQKMPLQLFDYPLKKYQLPELKRSLFEDAFDEIELLGFPVSCTPFDLLVTKYRGSVMVKDLLKYHKKEVKMLAYLISRKHVPTKRGSMFFGTWIDVEGQYFDTAHFPDSLKNYPFLGGGCYLLLGTVEVDFHFPTITIHKMAKMPFVPDPRYSNDEEKRYEIHQKIKEDVSLTFRKPYPQEHEIGLKRFRS